MLGLVNPGDLRAGDADRERVAERLRTALDEGRLNLHEYDERLRDAYAAKTYSELDALLADLPAVTAPSQSQVASRPSSSPSSRRDEAVRVDQRQPGTTGRWVVAMWGVWARVVSTCVLIWVVTSAMSGEITYFWPVWVAGPWGAVLLVQTVVGLGQGEPARWEARRVRRRSEREVRRRAREDHDRTA